MFNGEITSSGDITSEVEGQLQLKGHTEQLSMLVTQLSKDPIILGIPWLKKHDPFISWRDEIIEFTSEYCQDHCSQRSTGRRVTGREFTGQESTDQGPTNPESTGQAKPDIAIIGAAAYKLLAKRPENQLFSASIEDIEKALKPKTYVDPRSILPPEYHEFLDVFSRQEADALPPSRPYDHKIELKENTKLPISRLYPMSRDELLVLKKYLEEHLKKGFIRASSSPISAPVLFVKKPSGGLRLCVDYRALNALSTKNQYPLPLIRETLDRLAQAKYYTKLDIIAAFNRIRMAKDDEWKTAFRTRYGLFEYLVMPFGLTGAPSTFQHYINDVLREYLDIFCTAYLDDILIYSNSLKEHQKHVKLVLQALKTAGLQVEIEKCEFHTTETRYLGLIIGIEGIQMDPKKIETVKNWKQPQNLKDIQAFLGFANFYRRFILGFSTIVKPLTALTKKGAHFHWNEACNKAFQLLKDRFIEAPILRWFDPERRIIVETDSSDFVSGGILSQPDDNGVLHPVAYFSKKHSLEECNYEIYDKELLAIIRAFEEWRPELEGAKYPITVITDHRNLEYFMSTKLLNRRQARWSEFLSRFDFKITYRPGKQGLKPDSLTRRSEDLPQRGDQRLTHQSQVILKPKNFDLPAESLPVKSLPVESLPAGSLPAKGLPSNQTLNDDLTQGITLRNTHTYQIDVNSSLQDLFTKGYRQDPIPTKILGLLATGAKHSKLITLAECSKIEGYLHYRGKKYVPDYLPLKLEILRLYHDTPIAGHPGRAKTLELVSRDYYWPDIYLFVKRYYRNCHTCSRIKPLTQAYQGVLRPLPIPEQPWKDIAMDFITGLPASHGYNAILNVICRLTGMRHLIPCNDTVGSEDLAWLYLNHIWKLHGLPNSITSDRGPQFISKFWRTLCQKLGITIALSTAFHPQSDGKTERANALTEQYLRAYTSYHQEDWADWLPLAEFTGNSGYSESIKTNAFIANYGFNPRLGFEPMATQNHHPQALNAEAFTTKMAAIHTLIKAEIAEAQAHQELYKNRHRAPAPTYRPGDLVWLLTKNIHTERPSKKLDWKKIGPYKVKRLVSAYAYELELPPSMRIHPVFHTSLLLPTANDPHKGQIQEPPPPVIVNHEEEFEISAILDSKRAGRGIKYLIKWTGYDNPTWEPYNNIKHLGPMLIAFHAKYPLRAKPVDLLVI